MTAVNGSATHGSPVGRFADAVRLSVLRVALLCSLPARPGALVVGPLRVLRPCPATRTPRPIRRIALAHGPAATTTDRRACNRRDSACSGTRTSAVFGVRSVTFDL